LVGTRLASGSFCLVLVGLGTTVLTGSSGGDETDLSSRRSSSSNGRRFTNVLMVTTTVGMLDGVHSHTTNLGPAVSLGLVFVVGVSCLEHRLVETTSSGDDSNASSALTGNNLVSSSGWHFQSGKTLLFQVGKNDGVGSRGSAKLSSVTRLFLDIADVRTFWHISQGHAVSDSEVSLLSAENELSSEHSFDCDHIILLLAVSFLVEVLDNSQWCTTSRIVDNVNDLSLHIFLALSGISRSEFGGLLS